MRFLGRELYRGRYMEVFVNWNGPMRGIRRVAWGEAGDNEDHDEFGADEKYLEGKIPLSTGEVQVEDGAATLAFLKAILDEVDPVNIGLADLQDAESWMWVNVYNRARTHIRASTVVKRGLWNALPGEAEVDATTIRGFTFSAPRAWAVPGYGAYGERFTGNGILTTFDLTNPAVLLRNNTYAYVVGVDDVEQESGFTVSSTQLTFVTAPDNGAVIKILYAYLSPAAGS